jgi:hypothetical protein
VEAAKGVALDRPDRLPAVVEGGGELPVDGARVVAGDHPRLVAVRGEQRFRHATAPWRR